MKGTDWVMHGAADEHGFSLMRSESVFSLQCGGAVR